MRCEKFQSATRTRDTSRPFACRRFTWMPKSWMIRTDSTKAHDAMHVKRCHRHVQSASSTFFNGPHCDNDGDDPDDGEHGQREPCTVLLLPTARTWIMSVEHARQMQDTHESARTSRYANAERVTAAVVPLNSKQVSAA